MCLGDLFMHKILAFSLASIWVVSVQAQDPDTSNGSLADANNPLATFTAFNIQNYYVPELTELPDNTANAAWLRYARPTGNWLIRASLPISSVPISPAAMESGIGDLNAFAARLIDIGRPGVAFGVGPQVTLDTATEDATGTGKTQAGLTAVYFDGSSPIFQWGGLFTWQTDIGGSSNREDTESMALQPFYFLQLGNGLYFRGAPIWFFDREANTYQVPVGAGLGKVLQTDNIVFNVFIEPQYTVLSKGPAQAKLQIFAGFNMQFK
jgi:hypothetical protein